jgi:catechol 2,3-dioxygenase-like lactoylglutathione lyase family enzyme
MAFDRTEAIMAKVLGLGGVFFACADSAATKAWYARVLGMEPDEGGGLAFLHGESAAAFPMGARTVFAPFPDASYFAPSDAPFMLNLIVDDLDAILARAKAEGVEEVQPREEHPYGAFGWIMDPDGRKVELWQPPG